jgi:FAD/FMN-containing dehydrogenase
LISSSYARLATEQPTQTDVNRTDKHDGAIWNWSGSIVLHTRDVPRGGIIVPQSEAEVCALLAEASERKRATGRGGVKVLGSRLASSPMAQASADPDAVLLSLEQCRGIVSMDEESVTVLGSTQIGEVFNYLLDHGRNIACSPGVITYQTIGKKWFSIRNASIEIQVRI